MFYSNYYLLNTYEKHATAVFYFPKTKFGVTWFLFLIKSSVSTVSRRQRQTTNTDYNASRLLQRGNSNPAHKLVKHSIRFYESVHTDGSQVSWELLNSNSPKGVVRYPKYRPGLVRRFIRTKETFFFIVTLFTYFVINDFIVYQSRSLITLIIKWQFYNSTFSTGIDTTELYKILYCIEV